MATYVRTKGSDTWHWCKNCSQYPTVIGDTKYTRPESDLCNQCKAKEKDGTCKS